MRSFFRLFLSLLLGAILPLSSALAGVDPDDLPPSQASPSPIPLAPKPGFFPFFRQRGDLRILGWTKDSQAFAILAKLHVDCFLFSDGPQIGGDGEYRADLAIVLFPKNKRILTYFLSSILPPKPVRPPAQRSADPNDSPEAPTPISPCYSNVRAYNSKLKKAFLSAKAFFAWKRQQTFYKSLAPTASSSASFSPRVGKSLWLQASQGLWKISSSVPKAKGDPLLRLSVSLQGRTLAQTSLSLDLFEDDEPSSFSSAAELLHVWSPDGRQSVGILTEKTKQTVRGTQDETNNLIFLFALPKEPLPAHTFPPRKAIPWNGPWISGD